MNPCTLAIHARQLRRSYGATTALAGLDLQVRPGEILGVFGRNGSGKSTLLKLLAGVLEPSAGSLEICGSSLSAGQPYPKHRVGVLPEEPALIDLLSARENLLLAACAYGIPRAEAALRAERLLDLLELQGAQDRLPAQLSFGMAKKLSLAMALTHNPSLLLLDEPFEGIDPVHARTLQDLLAALAGKGVAVVLSSHSLSRVEALVHRFIILAQGELALASSMAELRDSGRGLEETFLRLAQRPATRDLEWIG